MNASTTTAPRPAGNPNGLVPVLKTILAPVASLRVTVVLLALSMILIFVGTSAQKELGLGEVLSRYFYSWICWVPTKYLFPLSAAAWEHLPGGFPFLGGYSLMLLLLVNLLAAHSVRFKFNWKRSGILLIHFSLILLIVGELATSRVKQEDQLTFREGDTRQWVHDIQDYELAVIDASPADHDEVVAIDDELLRRRNHVVRHERLPFEIKLEKWYPNSMLAGPQQQGASIDRLATAGLAGPSKIGVIPQPVFTGVEAADVDRPSAFVTLTASGGRSLGTYLVTVSPMVAALEEPQPVVVDGKTYGLQLRFKRTYLPYTMHLVDFTHDRHTGTDMASNFASRVRLQDPTNGVDREVVIRMNEPLRYAGRTYFQASFNPMDPKQTTLQVVDNPAWVMPYVACVLGAIGMLVHFGMHLVSFLRRRAKSGQLVPGFGSAATPPPPLPPGAKGGKKNQGDRDDARSYVLKPQRNLGAVLVPVAVLALALLYLVGHVMPPAKAKPDQFDLKAFGRIPVSFDGRVMPLDTLARSGLKIISGKESFKQGGKRVRAEQWLIDVLAGTPAADEYKVFRIDHPQIKALLGLKHEEKTFSFNDILFERPSNGADLQRQVDQARNVPDKRRDLYQRKVLDLHSHLALHLRLAQIGSMVELHGLWADREKAEALAAKMQEIMSLPQEKLTSEQRALGEQFGRLDQQIRRLRMLQQDPETRREDLYFVPPESPDGEWRGFGQTLIAHAGQGDVPADMRTFIGLIRDYRAGNTASFNADVQAYRTSLESRFPRDANRAGFEAFFNRFDPFTISIVFYLGSLLLVLGSWLVWQKPLWRGAFALLLLALVVHTVGLTMRIYISGRPPVTNLYSSAVFIAWGAVVLAVLLEAVFRNGLGIATSAAVGFLSLLIAGGLGKEGDTMRQLQAVLDTNFWLATHVVCITLGYSAMFLAWALAMAFIIGGVFTRAVRGELRKSLVRMTYGILCFAMFFSFVGTILGGIWADQSWGRFWGWDPKENGAVLIVLMVALVLHARWGGVVRERGTMVLTLLGGIVTAWSWFGTNMMGVGLHSYGFMESGVTLLSIYVFLVIGLMGLGMLPLTLWRSFKDEARPTSSNKRGFTPVPVGSK